MKVFELIEKLSCVDPESEVMILDGSNGAGSPRTINIGPREHVVSMGDVDETYDCEHLLGVTVQVIGFGSY